MEKKALLIVELALCLLQVNARGLPGSPLHLEFAQTSYRGLERYGYISVRLLLRGSNILVHNITVTVAPTDQSPVSAEGNGIDYDSNPIIASFNAGANITTINIPVINDNITEETETFDLTLTIPLSLSGQVVLGNISRAIGKIIDDASLGNAVNAQCLTTNVLFRLSVQATSVNVALSSDVTLTCKPSTLYTYQYNSFSWHRINGVIPMQSNGQNTNTLTIPSIKKDDQGMYYCMAIRHKVHCAVSDNVMVSVKVTCPSLSDPNNGMISCTLRDDGVFSNEDTCSFTCSIGYELTGSDTRTCQSDGSWSGSVAICSRVTCSPLSDPSNGMMNCSLEDNKVFSYGNICSFTCDTGYELIGSGTRSCQSNGNWSGSVAMCSGDMKVRFEHSTYIVNESDGKVELALFLNTPSSTDITIQVSCIDGSAAGKGVDYTPRQYTAHFNTAETQVSFNVSMHSVNLLEDHETFICRIDLHSLPRNVIVANPYQSIVTMLKNDDNIKVSFEWPIYYVYQSVEKAKPIIVFSKLSSINIVVQVVCNNGSATGEDVHYYLSSHNAQFNTATTKFFVSIPLLSNVITSKDNKVFCRISKSSLPSGVTVGKFDQTKVIIYF